MTRKLACTLPDGSIGTRRTDRAYTYCLVAFVPNPSPYCKLKDPGWMVLSWHGSLTLAEKAMLHEAHGGPALTGYYQDLRILPVDRGA